MCGFSCKKKERKVLNSSLSSLTHRNARTIKLVSLRVRLITAPFFISNLYTAILKQNNNYYKKLHFFYCKTK